MRRASSARRWLGLVAIALGVSLVVVVTTIVNVITPSVIADLDIDSSAAAGFLIIGVVATLLIPPMTAGPVADEAETAATLDRATPAGSGS